VKRKSGQACGLGGLLRNVAGGRWRRDFDNPKNLRHPTYWHARHYGLLAANPFGLGEFLHDRHRDGSFVIAAGGH